MSARTVPVIVDHAAYRSYLPPALGDRVRWQLFWNDPFAQWWSQLRPQWSLTAQLADTDTVARIGPELPGGTATQSGIGSLGDLRFKCRYTASVPPPATLTVAGALRMTGADIRRPGAAAPSRKLQEQAMTTGVVKRIQLVSILMDWRPGILPGTATQQPIAGTEWFYDLASPPDALHTYRPRQGRTGFTDEQLRQELLLVDLAVEQ